MTQICTRIFLTKWLSDIVCDIQQYYNIIQSKCFFLFVTFNHTLLAVSVHACSDLAELDTFQHFFDPGTTILVQKCNPKTLNLTHNLFLKSK